MIVVHWTCVLELGPLIGAPAALILPVARSFAAGWKASLAGQGVNLELSTGADVFVNMRINHGLCELLDVMFSYVCDGSKDLWIYNVKLF